MTRQKAFRILALSSAAFALQGCVAAVVPIAAGGLMGGSQISRNNDRDAEPAPQPTPTPVAVVEPAPAPAPPPAPEPAPEPEPEPTPVAVAVDDPVDMDEPASGEAEAETGLEDTQDVAEVAAVSEPEPEAEPEPVTVETTSGTEAIAATEPVYGPVDEPDENAAQTPVAIEEPAEDAPQEPVPVLVASLPDEPEPPAPVPDPIPTEVEDVAEEPSETPTRLALNEAGPAPAPAPMAATMAAPEPTPEATPEAAPAREPVEVAPAEPAPSPEPVAAPQPRPVAVPQQIASVTLFDPLVNYASSPEFESGSTGRLSAVLSDATALEPDRATCNAGQPTVLIDLDPEGQPLDLDANLTAPAALGIKLAQLRSQGIAIAWVSQELALNESAIRAALSRSGLDMMGNDRLLLIQDPEDRKQTLRDALAGVSCLVAIAGDTRSDFHELFDYLRNPSDANALQPMIGNGWFIIPTPLLPEGS